MTLPDALKDALMSGQTTEGHVRALSALEDPHLIIEAYKEVLKRNLSVRGTEELVRKIRSHHGIGPKKGAAPEKMRIVSEQVDQIEQGLQSILANHGTDMKAVKVKYMLTGTTAKLEIRMDGQPETTNEQIQRIYQALTSFYNPS